MTTLSQLAQHAGIALASVVAATAATAGEPIDWNAVSEVDVIEVVTQDADGDVRETKVWFVLFEGAPYLRTNGSAWLENIERDPNVVLLIEGTSYDVRADDVTTDALIEQVDAASRAKYGWQESLIHVFRMRSPQILRISARVP